MNFHPGSSKSKENEYSTLAAAINEIHTLVPDVILVLETMAGSKTNSIIGDSFEEIKKIIDLVKDKSRVGVCIDT